MTSSESYPSIEALKLNPERLVLIFSPFRARTLNPEHYDEKMKFWYRVVKEFSDVESRISFSLSDIQVKLEERYGKKPSCLEDVFASLMRNGDIFPLDQFRASLAQNNNTWFGWSTQLMKSGLSRLLRIPFMYGSAGTKIERDTVFVYKPQLMTQETKMSDNMNVLDQVKSLQEFKTEIVSTTSLKQSIDVDLLVEYMSWIGKLVADDRASTHLVKLISANSPVKNITQVERGQYDIQRTIAIIEADLNSLSEKKMQAETMARISLKEGKRATAKSYLRNKKQLESRMEKLTDILDNLSAVTIQIDEAESDSKVINAFEVGRKTLDKVLKDNNLTPDRINDMMIDIKDLLDEQEDVSANLAQPVVDEDTSLFEQELEELLKGTEPGKQTDTELLSELEKLKIEGVDDLNKSTLVPPPVIPKESRGEKRSAQLAA